MYKIIDDKKNRAWWCFTPRGLRRQITHLMDKQTGGLAEDWAKTAKTGDCFCAGRYTVEFMEVG